VAKTTKPPVDDAAEPTAPAPERRTAEEWAALKGHTPQFIDVTFPGARAQPQQLNPKWWTYAAAKTAWPIGQELTEAEFDAAIEAATNQTHR
jgi:hypothetical protein